MLTEVPRGVLSLDEYLALDLPEGLLTELVDGEVVMSPAPARPHQRLILRLARLLDDASPPGYEALVSPIDWVLWGDPHATVRQPDVAVVRYEQPDERRVTEPPLLVVEVLSPSSYERDVVMKRRQYARAGLDHYWIADPETGDIIRYGRRGGELLEVGTMTAGTRASVAEPFPVTFDPATLVGPRRV